MWLYHRILLSTKDRIENVPSDSGEFPSAIWDNYRAHYNNVSIELNKWPVRVNCAPTIAAHSAFALHIAKPRIIRDLWSSSHWRRCQFAFCPRVREYPVDKDDVYFSMLSVTHCETWEILALVRAHGVHPWWSAYLDNKQSFLASCYPRVYVMWEFLLPAFTTKKEMIHYTCSSSVIELSDINGDWSVL